MTAFKSGHAMHQGGCTPLALGLAHVHKTTCLSPNQPATKAAQRRCSLHLKQPTDPALATIRVSAGVPGPTCKPQRKVYCASFKLQIVREALLRPPSNRIKPICRAYPGIEPVSFHYITTPPHPEARMVLQLKSRNHQTIGKYYSRRPEDSGYYS